MTEPTIPAAGLGLPSSFASLAESAGGLAIVRMRGRAPRPSMLSDEENDRLLDLLNELVCARQEEDILVDRVRAMSHDVYIAKKREADAAAKDARRKMIGLLKKVKGAKSRTLDDILFKAMICEAMDVYKCRDSDTLGHSIVNDLLSAECSWRD